ncbi:hypothetical protein Sjap_016810 [Stephania japonica]|uniref:Uncharacterized protein n=1 Tax=Stephania japonica TaxID=461633 RepID=A0AAP0I541_9MAGN
MEKGSDALIKSADGAKATDIRVAYGEVALERSSAHNKYGCALPYKAHEEVDPLGSGPKTEKDFSSKEGKRAANGDGLVDGNSRSRSVLGDITNQLGKRRFVSISSNSNNKKDAENECRHGKFAREISSGAENLLRGKQDDSEFLADGKRDIVLTKASEGHVSLNLGSTNVQFPKGKTVSSVSGFPSEIKEFSGFFDGNRLVVLDSKGETIGPTTVCENKVAAKVGDDTMTNKPSSIESPFPFGSAVANVPEMHILTTGLGIADCANARLGMGSLKNCSCSFCLKAAYIWSDLHYQDAKCRLSAIKKSRKEFRLQMEKCLHGGGAYGNFSQESSNNSAELESDLLGQWRALFLHTDKILDREGSHLQSSILKLEELREDCKADLEMLHPTTSNH